MIKIIVLWIAGILLGIFGFGFKILYKPGRKLADLFLSLYYILMLFTQLAAIYFTGLKTALVAAIAVMLFLYYWFYFAPFYPNSDPAGNGMAMGFRSFFILVASFVLGVVSFFLIKFLIPNGPQVGLYLVLAVGALIGLYNLAASRRSYLRGDALDESARWERLRKDDYKKSLFRRNMVEWNDSWEAKELDAVPKEYDHWDVYGCKCIRVNTLLQRHCLLIEGSFEFPAETVRIHRSGFHDGCLGHTDSGDTNDDSPFVPRHMKMVWHDLAEGKTYRIDTDLPERLEEYFSNRERFRFDDLELRIISSGRVLIYHNRHNQIHNIKLDYPLQGEVTTDYEKEVAALMEEKHIDAAKYSRIKYSSTDITEDQQKRFRYHITFRPENDAFVITKTICNFFNGEKILSGGTWEETMDPSRIKDIFLRFESERRRYACFVYLDENEVLKAFDEIFGDTADAAKTDDNEANNSIADDNETNDSKVDHTKAEFLITVGDKKNAFEFVLQNDEKQVSLKNTEIRLYKVNEDESGSLKFKNYKGRHKNR